MYKVFIENRPIEFHFNSEILSGNSDTGKGRLEAHEVQDIWKRIDQYKNTGGMEPLQIQVPTESAFYQVFDTYQMIEAAGGLVQRNATFLFIRRNGFWDIPKGKLEKDERPETGAIREIEEECGLIQPVIKEHLINTWHTYEYKGRKVLKKTYWYWLEEGKEKAELIPQTEEGITEVAYFEVSDFSIIRKETFQSIIAVMEALLKKNKN